MNPFGNRAISASAGTGKTYALAHRYLALMAAGVPPDRICALTFSRKAAGEIFDTIVGRLCAAAADPAARAATAADIARHVSSVTAPAQAEEYVLLLRRLLDQPHRLRIGTLDSFILGIVRAFPLELGLPPDARPMNNDGGEAQTLRQTLLTRLFDPRQRERDDVNDRAGAAILNAFRQATFGTESKSLVVRLDKIIAEQYVFYRQHADKAWGIVDRVWPGARWWEEVEETERRQVETPAYGEALRLAFGADKRPAQLGETCIKIALAAAAHTAETFWPEQVVKNSVTPQLFKQACDAAVPELDYYGKRYALPRELWPPLRAALANLVGVEIARAGQRTAGLRALLERYDALYGEAQRRDGRLTFEDLSRLLADPAQRPSRNADADDKLYIDYRLDGQLDHWLLDEFQDTSDTQWGAIENLVDEVVQDPARSFFYVGDIKQSIYGWRGGNYRLFGKVRQRCGILSDPDKDTLRKCQRSLPAVIDAVNAVFDGLPQWPAACDGGKGPHPAAVAAFMSEWTPHESARRDAGKGFVALLEYVPRKGDADRGPSDREDGDEDEGAGEAAQYEAIARVLADVQPTRKDLSVAVLVRSNRQGRACVDVLRRKLPDLPVVHEGTGGIVDNPVVTLLLALTRYAAHPADTLALRHVQMSPLAAALEAAGGGLAGFPAHFLAEVHAQGFAGALRAWGERLAIQDPFGRQRLRELLAAAEEFDAAGSCDTDAFEDHIRAYQVKAQAAAGAVRVMTIHQSKGLGFDMVLAPFDPRDRSFADTRLRMLHSDLGRDERTAGGWVLQPPKREVLQAAGGAPVDAFDAARAEDNFAQLCVLYVAMTRAKQALYLLVPQRPRTSQTVREADLLRERLAGAGEPAGALCGLPTLYAHGDRDWCDKPGRPVGGAVAPPADAPPAPLRVAFVPDVLRREPSKEQAEGKAYPASWLFRELAGDVRVFGSALHRLFERIEWIEDADIEGLVTAWRAESMEPAAVVRNVEKQFRDCLRSPEALALLRRPAGAARCEVWRETPFSVVRDGKGGTEIVIGRFDRLIVERDGEGRPVRATVVDFKSNRVETDAALREAAAGYAVQMRDYAAAAARLLGLPVEQAATRLLFTRLAKVVAMPS